MTGLSSGNERDRMVQANMGIFLFGGYEYRDGSFAGNGARTFQSVRILVLCKTDWKVRALLSPF